MPWFDLDVSNSDGRCFRDEIEAYNEDEARIPVENLGYSINRIRKKRIKSFVTYAFRCVDRLVRPYRYDYLRQLEDLGTKNREKESGD